MAAVKANPARERKAQETQSPLETAAGNRRNPTTTALPEETISSRLCRMPDPSPTDRALCARVVIDLDAATPSAAIEQLAGGFASIPGVPSGRTLAASALEREAQAATFLGHGTALPHARLIGLPHLSVAFARTRKPIPWTRDGDLVDLIFLGVVPAAQPRHYLEFMRKLARALTDDSRAAALRQAPDEAAVRAWLGEHLQLQ